MALYAVGFGTPQFSRAPVARLGAAKRCRTTVAPLSDALAALQAPQILATSVRTSAGTQMATLCLVRPRGTPRMIQQARPAPRRRAGVLGNALAAYATVLAD